MRIIGHVVKHESFGIGVVIAQHDDYIIVNFTCGHKEFLYPSVFKHILQLTDPLAQEKLLELIE